jgi:hypothetical protein
MNLQLKALTLFVVFLLVVESYPLHFCASDSFSQNLMDSSSFTFGNTSIGTLFDQNDANAKSASSFTCGDNGQVTEIYAYIARAYSTGSGKAAIYADNLGQPGALLAQSSDVSITTDYSWVDFELPTPWSVISGTVYWLAICSDEPLKLSIVLESGVRTLNGNTYSEGFSDPFGSVWATDPSGAMSIYAGGNMDGSELSVSISPTSANTVLGGYQQFTSRVTGGVSPFSYQWYIDDTAIPDGTSQNWIFTPTTAGTYKIYLIVTDSLNNEIQSNFATDIVVSQSQFDFSIMQISDTQNLAWYHADWYNQLTAWIVDNSAAYKLKMVIHTGDLTENYDAPSEWQNANAAMSILANNGIPYTWCAGNHDQNGMDNPDSGWVGDQYAAFNPASFSGNSYWVGDDNQGKNTAVKFSVDGYNFLVINLECQANEATMAWATNLLDTYSSLNYNIIVGTHAYLDSPNMTMWNHLPSSPAWEQNLLNLLNRYPRVFMTLNGHTGGWPVGLSVHNQVNGRTQTEFDRQDAEIDEGAAVRIFSFDLNNQVVTASTFSVPTSTWITDLGSSYSFSANLVSTPVSTPTVSITPMLVRMDLGQSQIFDSTVTGGSSPFAYQWYLNDNAVSGATGAHWTFTPTQSGQYSIYLNVVDSLNHQAKSNVVSDIVVYTQPSVSINPVSTNITLGGFQQFNSVVTGGLAPYTYQWYCANGTAISGSTTPTLIYTTNFTGTYGIYLNATDSLNYRFQSNIAIINIYSQTGATITPTSLNMTIGGTQLFNSTVTGGLLPYTFQWYYSNDTKIIGETNPTLSYKANSTGTYNIYLNVTDQLNFKTQSNTATINVYSQPSTIINPNSVNITVGNTQQFNSTTIGGLAPYSFQWYYSNETAISGAISSNLFFIANSTGTYNIYLNATDKLNSKTQSNIAAIYVYSQPSVAINPTSVNMTVQTTQKFASTVTDGLIPYSYQWYLNDTLVIGATNGTWNFTPETVGNFKVYLNVTDALNSVVKSNTVFIAVYEQLNATISPNSVSMINGTSQTFSSTITGGAIPFTYQWYMNSSKVIGATSPNWIFTPPLVGTYIIYLNVSDTNAVSTKSNFAIAIVETPIIANISPIHLRMYLGQNQTFSSSISGGTAPYSYQWCLNNTAVANALNANWTFAPISPGNYRVYLNVTDALNIKTQSNIVTDITVYPQLTVSISPTSINTTVGNPQIFVSNVSGGAQPYSYQWYLNGSSVADAINNSWTFIPASKGTYNIFVNVTDTNNVATQSNNATVIVETPTNVTINPTQVKMYLGQSQTINSSVLGGTAPYSYQWYQNDTAIPGATNQNLTFTPSSSGNYKIYLTVTDALNILSRSESATNITVYSQLLVSINPTSVNLTLGTNQTFVSNVFGGAQPYTYQWYLNGSPILNANANNWTFIPASSGNFSIYLKVADNYTALAQSNSATIIVESSPNVTISNVQVRMNLGQSQTFNSTVSGGTAPYTYQWYLNNTAVLGGTNQKWTFTPTTSGNYEIYLNVTDALNISVKSNVISDITVYPLLTASISPVLVNIIINTPQTFSSNVSGGAQSYSYQWILNGTEVPGATNADWIFTPTSMGIYQIYLNVTDNNGAKAKSNYATATVNQTMTVNITPTEVKMYIGQSQKFNSTVIGGTTPYTYQWYLNDSAVLGANSRNWTFTPTLAGHYKIYLNITDALNIKTQSNIVTDITVYQELNASISPSTVNMTLGMQQTFNSTVSGGAQPYTYQWFLNGTAVLGATNSTWNFTPTQIGNYSVYLKVTDSLNNQAQSNVAMSILVTSELSSINLVSGGSYYTTPAIIISGGGGTGATATARVSQGVIYDIVITNPGTGYSSAPTITIRDPSPRANGASATAII